MDSEEVKYISLVMNSKRGILYEEGFIGTYKQFHILYDF